MPVEQARPHHAGGGPAARSPSGRPLLRVLRAEAAKAARRPAVWVLAAVPTLLTLATGYLFAYFTYRRGLASPFAQEVPVEVQLRAMLPAEVGHRIARDAAVFGLYLAAVLGALLAGSEYGWRTVRTAGLQGPGRLALAAGKPLAAGLVLVAITLALTVTSLAAATLVALAHGGDPAPPPPGTLLQALGAVWLVLAAGCMLGLVLAVATRNASVGLGGALLVLIGVQGLVDVAARDSAAMARVQSWLPAHNADALATGFPGGARVVAEAVAHAVDPGRAAWTLLAYVVACALAATAIPLRRDVTE